MKINNFLHHTFISDYLDPSSIVIDLGANKGEFTEFITNKFGSKVYAVEPVPELFNKIPNSSLIIKDRCCISNKNGFCELNIAPNHCPTTHKILDQTRISKKIKVKVKNFKNFLDQYNINKVDLLKIDIEGEEFNLLKDIDEKTLDKIHQITVEFHDFLWPELEKTADEIKKKLVSKGFYCVSFSLTNNGDILFVKKNKISFLNYTFLKYFLRYIMGFLRIVDKLKNRFLKRWL